MSGMFPIHLYSRGTKCGTPSDFGIINIQLYIIQLYIIRMYIIQLYIIRMYNMVRDCSYKLILVLLFNLCYTRAHAYIKVKQLLHLVTFSCFK